MGVSTFSVERLKPTHGTVGALPPNFDPLRFCRLGGAHEERHALIAKAAYMRAKRRGFEAGHELEDWLAAEAEINSSPNSPT
jgi:hypothetical protein